MLEFIQQHTNTFTLLSGRDIELVRREILIFKHKSISGYRADTR